MQPPLRALLVVDNKSPNKKIDLSFKRYLSKMHFKKYRVM